jgi:cytochrome d ubiquinol oxidase subunit I
MDARRVRFGIEIPGGLSVAAFGDARAEVRGLNAFPREDWPPVPLVHLAFQAMVGCGTALLGVAAWGAFILVFKRPLAAQKRFLAACALVAPLGLAAVEAGWIVTEVGRQPWIIQGVMHTRDAVTPMPNLVVSFVASTVIYAFLGGVVALLLTRYVLGDEAPAETHA